jgi:hypothetical protein
LIDIIVNINKTSINKVNQIKIKINTLGGFMTSYINRGAEFVGNKIMNALETGGATVVDDLKVTKKLLDKAAVAGVGMLTLAGGVSKGLVSLNMASPAKEQSIRLGTEKLHTLVKNAAFGTFYVVDSLWSVGKGTINFIDENAGDIGAVALGVPALIAWHAAAQTWDGASQKMGCEKRTKQALAIAEGAVAALLTLGAAWSGGLINAHESSFNTTRYFN